MLIRDVPEDVVAAIDANADRVGLSRAEYVRRMLASERHRVQAADERSAEVSVEHFRRLAETFADARDPEIMAAAWR